MIRFLFLLGGLGTGETLHMSQQEKSPLWIQSPEETSRVWIHGSRFSVPVPYNTQLKHTHISKVNPENYKYKLCPFTVGIVISVECLYSIYQLWSLWINSSGLKLVSFYLTDLVWQKPIVLWLLPSLWHPRDWTLMSTTRRYMLSGWVDWGLGRNVFSVLR